VVVREQQQMVPHAGDGVIDFNVRNVYKWHGVHSFGLDGPVLLKDDLLAFIEVAVYATNK
jgi:hypothetical protein